MKTEQRQQLGSLNTKYDTESKGKQLREKRKLKYEMKNTSEKNQTDESTPIGRRVSNLETQYESDIDDLFECSEKVLKR